MISAIYGYLREYFPESEQKLTRIVEHLELLAAEGRLPRNFWGDMATATGILAGGTAVTAGNCWGISHLTAHIASPPTLKMARVIKLMGAKGAKIYLYTVYGLGVANGVLTGAIGVSITLDTLKYAKAHYERHKRRMRDARIADLVAENRRRRLQ